MKVQTDYPFPFLGDTLGKDAPMREVKILWWDGDKYATIEIEKKWITKVKIGYCYSRHFAQKKPIGSFNISCLKIREEH